MLEAGEPRKFSSIYSVLFSQVQKKIKSICSSLAKDSALILCTIEEFVCNFAIHCSFRFCQKLLEYPHVSRSLVRTRAKSTILAVD